MVYRSIVLGALLFSVCALRADVFEIGGTEVTVPAPRQFLRVTPQMPQVQKLIDQMDDSLNHLIAAYVSPTVAEESTEEVLSSLDNYFLLKVSKAMVEPVVSAADFEKLRHVVLTQQEHLLADVRKRMPNVVERFEQSMEGAFGREIAMEIGEILPLGIYINEESMLGFSMLIKVNAGLGEGAQTEGTVIASCMLVNVSGKVLFLYAYGNADELMWTRERSLEWASAVLSANAPTPSAEGRGIDLNRVLRTAIIGALIGAAVGIGGFFWQKYLNRKK